MFNKDDAEQINKFFIFPIQWLNANTVSKFPVQFRYRGGNLSNDDTFLVLDKCMPQEDVARIAYSMYSQYVDSGFFFEETDVLNDFFSVQEDLKVLFDDLN